AIFRTYAAILDAVRVKEGEGMVSSTRAMLVGLTVAAALVLGVASAGAGPNLVLNPGFETACGSVPCNWNASSSGTITRDTVNPHTGAASIAVAGNGAFTVFDSFSDCFLVAPSTTYTVQGWYRAAPTSLMTSLTLALLAYSNTSCGQQLVSGDGPIVASPVKTDTWTFVTGQVTTGANVGSARLLLRGGCGANK